MNGVNHKVEYWDSRISGKKKLAVDGKVLTLAKDADNFTFHFKIGEYFFVVLQNEDEKPKLLINNRDFNVILKDERTGKLQKENENYNKNKKSEIKKNIGTSETDYYKRALKYNGDNYVEGNDGEIYDIEEQRKRLEEFEKKKEKENEEKKRRNKINSDNDKINKNNDINKKQENKKLKFVLNNETVRKNKMIIQNIDNIFDDDNLLDLNGIDFNQNNNNYNNQDNMLNNNNNDYNFGQMNNVINNNQKNQDVVNQFLSNMENNNNDYNFNNDYNNNGNNNYMNPNEINKNNNYNDDFNPFDD